MHQTQNEDEQRSEKTSKKDGYGFCLAGFILSFFIPILGIIFSAIGLVKVKKAQIETGKRLAVAGIAISIVWTIIVFTIATLSRAALASM